MSKNKEAIFLDISKRVAYLRGLIDGLKIDDQTKEGQVLLQVVDILQDMAEELTEIRVQQEDLEDYMNIIDEDLYDLEDEVYSYDDDYDFEDTDYDDDYYDYDDDEFDGDYVEVECPECHDKVCFEADILDDENVIEVACPNCDTVVFVNDEEYEEEPLEDDEDI